MSGLTLKGSKCVVDQPLIHGSFDLDDHDRIVASRLTERNTGYENCDENEQDGNQTEDAHGVEGTWYFVLGTSYLVLGNL